MQQVLVFDEQTNSFKRDYAIEEFFNNYNKWWLRNIGYGETLGEIFERREEDEGERARRERKG